MAILRNSLVISADFSQVVLLIKENQYTLSQHKTRIPTLKCNNTDLLLYITVV